MKRVLLAAGLGLGALAAAPADNPRPITDPLDLSVIGGELVDRTASGAPGSVLLVAPTVGGKPDLTADTFPLVVLPLRTADTHWTTALAARREKEKQPPPAPADLLGLRASAPVAAWQVRFGGKDAELEAGGKSPANARLVAAVGSTRIVLRADAGQLPELTATARNRLAAQFVEFDADGNGSLAASEITSPMAAPSRTCSRSPLATPTGR